VIDMAQTEAQLKASKKYHEKFDLLQIRVPSGEKKLINDHAASGGESLNGFVRRAIAETMARDQSHTEETSRE
jgi:predicted HicB family RNase H-like nuclease